METKIRNSQLTGALIAGINIILSYLYFKYYIYSVNFSYFGLLFAAAGTLCFTLYRASAFEVKSNNAVTIIFITNMFIDVSMFVMYLFFSLKFI